MSEDLPNKMLSLAEGGHPMAEKLKDAANKLLDELGSEDFNVKRLVGRWARARRIWSEATGEDLL